MAKDGMGSLVSFGLIGAAVYIGGGYFGFWPLPSFLQSSPQLPVIAPPGMVPAGTTIVPATTVPTGIIPASTPPTAPVLSPPVIGVPRGGLPVATPPALPPATSPALATQLITQAGSSGPFTYDGWNYYYNQIFGAFQQAASGIETRNTLMTVQEFISNSPGLASARILPTGLHGLGAGLIPTRLMPQASNYVRRRVF